MSLSTYSTIAIGDIHLGKLDRLIPGTSARQIKTLRAILDAEPDAKDVVLLGDLFDTPSPSQRLVTMFLDVFAAYRGKTFHVIGGNHDVESTYVSALHLYKWLAASSRGRLRVYKRPAKRTLADGFRYTFVPHPYRSSNRSQDAMADRDHPEKWAGLGAWFGHFPINGAKRDNGSVERHGLDLKQQLAKVQHRTGAAFWVLGDFHGHQHGDSYVYAGSMTKTAFAESEQVKGYLRVHGRDWEFVPLTGDQVFYDLERQSVRSAKQLAALRDSVHPRTYLSVTFSDGFVPHEGWQAEHPQIVSVHYAGFEDQKKAAQASGLVYTSSLEEDLEAWLRAKQAHLSDEQVKAAIEFARNNKA